MNPFPRGSLKKHFVTVTLETEIITDDMNSESAKEQTKHLH